MHPIHRQRIPGFAMPDPTPFLRHGCKGKKNKDPGTFRARQPLDMDRLHGGPAFYARFSKGKPGGSVGKIFTIFCRNSLTTHLYKA